MSRPPSWQDRCLLQGGGRRALSIRSPTAISRRSPASSSTGRACGFEVVAAGKGTKYLPAYHSVTPDDVWAHYGLTPEEVRRVQLLSRRDEIRDRDGRDRERHRARRAGKRSRLSALRGR